MSLHKARPRRSISPVGNRGAVIEILESRQLLSAVQTQGHAAITAEYNALGGIHGFLAAPIGNETLTVDGKGLYRCYQGGMIVWSAATGAHEVHGAIVNKYNEIGAANSYLGFPIADEMFTPSHDGRVSNFQHGAITYIYATGIATITSTVPLPTIDVLTPPNAREGDVITVTEMNGIPNQLCDVKLIGDNNSVQYQFPSGKVDVNGNATLALPLPYVLAKGIAVDGRTIRVTSGTFSKDFTITLHEGERVGISSDTIQEGNTLTVKLRNGVGSSQVIAQLIHDNNEVVHEWGYMQTDSSGIGSYGLVIPTVLSGAMRIDGYGLRIINGGVVTDLRIAITEGFRVELGAQKVREIVSNFPMGIRNATPNATVTLKWYLDDDYRATQTFRTDGNGDGNFTVPTPKLIKNSADSDMFRIVVTVNGQSTAFEFKMLVYKYTPANHDAPPPGDPQVQKVGPLPVKKNSAPGVKFNTPSAGGIINERQITKTENPTLAPKDPVTTVQDRMSHQLVILCYGSDQHPGDNELSQDNHLIPGMDQVYKGIEDVAGHSHVIRVASGNKSFIPKENLLNADKATADAEKTIADTINLLSRLGQRIDSVTLAGYSWGGGMALELANWITSTYHIEIAGLAYVDAVVHGLISYQNKLPNVKPQSFLNIYESIHTPQERSYLEGNAHVDNPGLVQVNSGAGYGQYEEFDTDAHVNVTDHANIDKMEASLVAEFIKNVLYGWYGKHLS